MPVGWGRRAAEGSINTENAVVKKITVGSLIALAVVIGLALVPKTVVLAPEWRVKVLDHEGKPVGEANLTVSWNHYEILVGSVGQAMQRTSKDGGSNFPKREIVTSALYYLIAAGENAVMSVLPHGGGVPVATIDIWVDGKVKVFERWHPGDPEVIDREIRLQPCDAVPSDWSCDPGRRKMLRELYPPRAKRN
jgi:hypothetical protein